MATVENDQQKVFQFVRVIQELSLARDLNKVMDIVKRNARTLTSADGTTFVLREEGLCYYADEEAISPLWKGSRFPIQSCISGWSMKAKKPAIIQDIYQDDRIPLEVYEPTFVRSLAMVPIRTTDPIGAIGLYWKEPYKVKEEEVALLTSLAGLTAVTMENVNIYNELDKRVKERTAQLEAYSHSVAHDLKNPLAGMEMRLSTLWDEYSGQMDEKMRDIVGDLQDTVDNMKTMIQGLLEVSRLGEKGLNKERTDLGQMVRETIDQLKALHPKRNIRFKVHELPVEFIDPTLFQRVWVNLIGNAIEYTKEREQASIEIGVEEQKGERLYFIRDNGKGFNPENAGELFKVFQRFHPDEKFEGTGIGLSIVEQIIYKHGGAIWAEGEPDKGATFYFTLPWSSEKIKPTSPN